MESGLKKSSKIGQKNGRNILFNTAHSIHTKGLLTYGEGPVFIPMKKAAKEWSSSSISIRSMLSRLDTVLFSVVDLLLLRLLFKLFKEGESVIILGW